MSSLQTRLQDPGYINWVKAGLCLIHTKEGLEEFADNESNELHGNILAHLLPNTGHSLGRACISKTKLMTTCGDAYCQSFATAVIQEGIDPNHKFTIGKPNLANTDAGQWHSQPWELAKLFMNQGQLPTQTQPSQTDLSGIINFLTHCRVPRNHVTNVKLFDEVREARNKIMHTSDMKVSASDLGKYTRAMIDLLQDPGIYCYPRAQVAVTDIRKIFNSADFQITLEDESKVIERLSESLEDLVVEIRTELTDMAESGRKDSKTLTHLQADFQKVSDSYATLEQKVGESSKLQQRLETNLTNLRELLEMTKTGIRKLETRVENLEINVHNIKQQQEEHTEDIRNVLKQQGAHNEDVLKVKKQQDDNTEDIRNVLKQQDVITEDIRNVLKQQVVHTDNIQSVCQQQETQTQEIQNVQKQQKVHTEDIRNVKKQQLEGIAYLERRQDETEQVVDSLKLMTSQQQGPIPLGKDKADLKQYLKDIYQKKLDVTILPKWIEVHVSQVFFPLIVEGEKTILSFKDMFPDGSRNPLFLLGDAGAGKSTFCKHLTDLWATPNGSTPQFLDVNVLKQFEYFFFVSCRYASEKDSILKMIDNQLFRRKDVAIRNAARYMLEQHPDLCLILVDGLDEWDGSFTSDTGRPDDIKGLPSFSGVEDCTILISSRPWRFEELSITVRSQCRRFKIYGIRNEAELVGHVLQKLNDPEHKQTCHVFLREIRENSMSEIIKTPLMLIVALDIWKNEKSICTSLCMNYVKMIILFISRAEGIDCWPTSEKRISFPVDFKVGDPSCKWPHCFSVNELLQRYSGLLLSLGNLACDRLLGRTERSLVFSKTDCVSILHDENGEKLKVCLAVGLLSKTETTVLGIEKVEIYSFPHKTFQEFFAALWLAVKYSDENMKLYQIIKSWKHLSEYEILIRFICGLIPEAGMELWTHVTEQDIWQKGRGVPHFLTSFDESNKIQTLILQSMKEARDCGDKQAEQVYYQSPAVVIDGRTSEEDKTLLCNMMEYYSDTKYSQATVKNANLSKTLYQSILSSVSHASFIQVLKLGDISSSNECISLLDLQYNQVLKALTLNKLPATDLRLPSDSNSHPLGSIVLRELVLTHASLEKLCNSLSDLSHVKYMKIANLTCRDHSCIKTCCLFVLDLHSHHELCDVELCQLPLRDMILPSVDHSLPPELNLCDLVFSTKTLGQLCTYLSGWLDLADVKLSSFLGRDKSCGNTCCLSVLDLLSRHGLQKLDSNRLPLNDSILPSDNELKPSDLTLCDLVLSHKGLEHLCNSRSNPFHLNYVKLTDLSCSNHSCDEVCSLYLLDLMSQNETSPLPLELGLLPLRELIPTTDDDSQPSGLTLCDLALSHKNLEQLFRNILASVKIESVKLSNLSCRDHPCSESRCLSELDLQSHHMLFSLRLCQVPLKGLILPSHDLSPLCQLRLCDLVLTHKSIEQAFTFCKYPSGRYYPNCVELSNLSCSDHLCSGACSVLDLEFNSILVKLKLCKLPISELILPRERVGGSLELFDLALTHKSLEHICSSLSCPSDLRHVKLINLLCRDHSSKNKCSLSLLDLHTQHHLESLQLTKITVEGLLLPTKNSEMLRSRNLTKKTFIHLEDTNMSLEGWRNFIDALLHTENDCKVKVILTSCNIDSDTRMLISDSLQFRVVRNDDSLVKIELVNSDTHSDSEPEDCTGDKQDWQFY